MKRELKDVKLHFHKNAYGITIIHAAANGKWVCKIDPPYFWGEYGLAHSYYGVDAPHQSSKLCLIDHHGFSEEGKVVHSLQQS
jgi:hypothetical protein